MRYKLFVAAAAMLSASLAARVNTFRNGTLTASLSIPGEYLISAEALC